MNKIRKGAPLRILIITEEDEFYLPLSIQYILDNCPYEIAEVLCVRNVLLRSKFKAACKFYAVFGLLPILSHGLRLAKAKALDTFTWLNFTGQHFSVKRVCQAHGIAYARCENVNSLQFLNHCRQLGLDLIAAISPSQIFV